MCARGWVARGLARARTFRPPARARPSAPAGAAPPSAGRGPGRSSAATRRRQSPDAGPAPARPPPHPPSVPAAGRAPWMGPAPAPAGPPRDPRGSALRPAPSAPRRPGRWRVTTAGLTHVLLGARPFPAGQSSTVHRERSTVSKGRRRFPSAELLTQSLQGNRPFAGPSPGFQLYSSAGAPRLPSTGPTRTFEVVELHQQVVGFLFRGPSAFTEGVAAKGPPHPCSWAGRWSHGHREATGRHLPPGGRVLRRVLSQTWG